MGKDIRGFLDLIMPLRSENDAGAYKVRIEGIRPSAFALQRVRMSQ